MNKSSWRLGAFLHDRLPHIGIALLCIMAAAGILVVARASTVTTVLVCALLLVGLGGVLSLTYVRDARFWQQVDSFSDDPTSARFIASLLCEPKGLEAQLTRKALRAQGTTATDEINAAHNESAAYQRYIELWVHQAKAAVASAQLTLSQMHGAEADSVRADIARIEAQIEQALYYARTQTVQNDYFIREVKLADIVNAAVRKQARRMIQASVAPRILIDTEECVLTDEKWLVFILGQIIDNSAKYGAHTIEFSSGTCNKNTADGYTWLRIADDGEGIPATDVPRVFERGFTGTAGRTHHPATGMGLYLVACACRDMNLGIELESEEGYGTTITISFPQDCRRMELAQHATPSTKPANLTKA